MTDPNPPTLTQEEARITAAIIQSLFINMAYNKAQKLYLQGPLISIKEKAYNQLPTIIHKLTKAAGL